jgi:hypothetical protein
MLKRLIILFAIDLAISLVWIKSLDLDPSVAIYLIFCLPTLFIVNAVLGILLKVLRKSWANAILLNSLINPVCFYFLFVNEINSGVKSSYKNVYFQKNSLDFNIVLNTSGGNLYDSSEFEFYKIDNSGSWTIGVRGRYFLKKDTIILITDSSKVMKIHDHILYDYQNLGDTLKIRDRR